MRAGHGKSAIERLKYYVANSKNDELTPDILELVERRVSLLRSTINALLREHPALENLPLYQIDSRNHEVRFSAQDKVSGVYSEYQPTDGDLKGGELKDSTTMANWEYRDGDAVYNLTAPAESLRFRGKLKSG